MKTLFEYIQIHYLIWKIKRLEKISFRAKSRIVAASKRIRQINYLVRRENK